MWIQIHIKLGNLSFSSSFRIFRSSDTFPLDYVYFRVRLFYLLYKAIRGFKFRDMQWSCRSFCLYCFPCGIPVFHFLFEELLNSSINNLFGLSFRMISLLKDKKYSCCNYLSFWFFSIFWLAIIMSSKIFFSLIHCQEVRIHSSSSLISVLRVDGSSLPLY